jgi:hypothetical protein
MHTNQSQGYQPQPQYQQQQPPQQQPVRLVPHSKPWHIAKIVLHSLSLTFSLIVLGISVALSLNLSFSVLTVLWTAPQACLAIIWAVAEFITICVRRGHLGIHPGAHVGIHLILWLGFGIAVGLDGYYLAVSYLFNDYSYYSSYYDYYYYYDNSEARGMLQAIVAFVVLLM